MERPVIDRAVTEKGDTDPVGIEQSGRVTRSGCLEDAWAYHAAGAHQTDFGREEMHAAAASPGTAGLSAEQLRDQRAGAHALCEGVSVSPVRTEYGVVVAKMRADPCGNRLFTHIGVAGAVNQSAHVCSGQLFFAAAYQDHSPVYRYKPIFRGRCIHI